MAREFQPEWRASMGGGRRTRSGRRTSFKAVVNDCLRRGLEAPSEAELAAPFSVEPRPMGLRAGLDLDDIGGLLELLDGPVRP